MSIDYGAHGRQARISCLQPRLLNIVRMASDRDHSQSSSPRSSPKAKRFKFSPQGSSNGSSKLKVDFLLKGDKKDLTSDGCLSEEKIQASQLDQQPFKIWYGTNSDDEPDSAADVDPAADPILKPVSKWVDVGAGMPPFPPTSRPIPTGKHTTVAILDSGVNEHHSALIDCSGNSKAIVYSRSFVDGSCTDTLGHGTQCAGLICGSPDSIQVDATGQALEFQGIAPDARIMVCKVVKDGTDCADIEAVCNAFDWILEFNRKGEEQQKATDKVDVISLSFGKMAFDHNLTKKIQEAVNDNIIVVCAASNNGKKGRNPITYPARLGHVLCIGACTTNHKPTDSSPVGRELDFLAPGEGIWAPTVGANRYCVVDGTSYAAPLVAGIVSQIIEDMRRLSDRVINELEPSLWERMHNVWCMREVLKEMAAVRGHHSEKSGYGSLDPSEYFKKSDEEKLRIISDILQNA